MRRPAVALLTAFTGAALLVGCSSDGGDTTSSAVSTTEPDVLISPPSQNVEPEGTQSFSGLEQTHVDTPVQYPQTPPVGGPHNPAWQTCAVYDQSIASEMAVHSMEHGAVWITYSPDLPADQVSLLVAAQAAGPEVLVSPFEGLPTPVVASAWGKQLQLQSADDPRLLQFVAFFSDGPQTPEPNTPCSGGVMDTAG